MSQDSNRITVDRSAEELELEAITDRLFDELSLRYEEREPRLTHPVPTSPTFAKPSPVARPYVQTKAPLSQSLGDLISPAMAAKFGVIK